MRLITESVSGADVAFRSPVNILHIKRSGPEELPLALHTRIQSKRVDPVLHKEYAQRHIFFKMLPVIK